MHAHAHKSWMSHGRSGGAPSRARRAVEIAHDPPSPVALAAHVLQAQVHGAAASVARNPLEHRQEVLPERDSHVGVPVAAPPLVDA